MQHVANEVCGSVPAARWHISHTKNTHTLTSSTITDALSHTLGAGAAEMRRNAFSAAPKQQPKHILVSRTTFKMTSSSDLKSRAVS